MVAIPKPAIGTPGGASSSATSTAPPYTKLEYKVVTPQFQVDGAPLQAVAARNSIAGKLRSIGSDSEADRLEDCHTHQFHELCHDCRTHRAFWNSCSQSYCPICAPKLAKRRRDSIKAVTKYLSHPLHVVLTQRNFPTLTKRKIRECKAAFSRLRRSKFAANWRGGCYSLEITNEGRGWHLHIHCLIDAHWIDAAELARQWGHLVGQEFGIVCVKRVHGDHYLRELTKYVVKGSQMAGWEPEEILEFIRAIKGSRMFGTFGELFKLRAAWTADLDGITNAERACPCGCTHFHYYDENEWEAWLLDHGPPAPPTPRPRPVPDAQQSFIL